MRKRYLCDLTKYDQGREILVLLVPISYAIATIIGIIFYCIIGNFNFGTFLVSLLMFGNLGWIAYLLVIFPLCYFISSIHKNIDQLR